MTGSEVLSFKQKLENFKWKTRIFLQSSNKSIFIYFANVATIWSSTEIDDSRLTITCFSNMLSNMAVDSRLNVSSEVKFVYLII
jgi:hypothetical protein